MFKLEEKDYSKVLHLVNSQNELSVFSVIIGIMPGEIYVNSIDNPTAVLIQTSECNLVAGTTEDVLFNSEVSTETDFWDQLTPDSSDWIEIVPTIHQNPFIRKYVRRHYVLSLDQFKECKKPLKDGFVIEKVNPHFLKQCGYENSEKLLDWIENWGDDAKFLEFGTGYFIHNQKDIVSWSLSDCSCDKKIAIGIQTDERYRKNGFGEIVVSAVIKDCFAKGYEQVEWLCVDTNKGSIAIAEKLGFKFNNRYYSFSTYPPIENIKDLSEAEWYEWAEYLENASKTADCLIWECLQCYIKANHISKTIEIMTALEADNKSVDYNRFIGFIQYLQNDGLCTNFKKQVWLDFIASK